MNSQLIKRAALYSVFSGVGAGVIYVIIALATGGKLSDSSVITGALTTGAITLVIAFVLYCVFTTIFSKRKSAL